MLSKPIPGRISELPTPHVILRGKAAAGCAHSKEARRLCSAVALHRFRGNLSTTYRQMSDNPGMRPQFQGPRPFSSLYTCPGRVPRVLVTDNPQQK